MNSQSIDVLEVKVPLTSLSQFHSLLQRGFILKALVGCTVRSLFLEQFGLPSDYVFKNLSTIFMDGKPVDDIDTAIVTDGVTIALSSAMPGLVGATMRSGGPLASLREGISYKPSRRIQDLSSGTIRLKLFNSVMGELGEQFLRKGVRVESSVLAEWLWSRPEDFRRRQCNVSINGNEHMIEILKIMDLLKSKDVYLRVNWEKPEVS